MNSQESPFIDLDLFCDWTADPGDPVMVRFSMEVRVNTVELPSAKAALSVCLNRLTFDE